MSISLNKAIIGGEILELKEQHSSAGKPYVSGTLKVMELRAGQKREERIQFVVYGESVTVLQGMSVGDEAIIDGRIGGQKNERGFYDKVVSGYLVGAVIHMKPAASPAPTQQGLDEDIPF